MKDTAMALGIVLVILGGSALDSPNMLFPISIIVLGGVIAALTGAWRG